jgi:antitoxin component of MazEF toxin-antitoxin module
MKFKSKLRKIGNSLGIIIPKDVITYIEDKNEVNIITAGDYVCLEVITDDLDYCDLPEGIIK